MADALDQTRFHPPDMMPLAEEQREQDRDEAWQEMRRAKDAIIDLCVALGWTDDDFLVLAYLAVDQLAWRDKRHGRLYGILAAMKEEIRCGRTDT